MAKSLGESIKKAAIEGKLCTMARKFLTRKLDYALGKRYRYRWTKKMKVDPKQIMFISFQGDYTCNPKYIAEELRKRNKGYKIVWSAREESLYNESFPPEFKLVTQYSMDFYRELGRSKMVVSNSVEFQKKMSAKKKDQIWMETWHGSLGIKRFDASSNNGREWVAAAKRVGKLSDYIISNSTFENDVYRGTFWPKTTILEYGHPRNDILFNRTDALRTEMLKKVILSPLTIAMRHIFVSQTNDDTLATFSKQISNMLSKVSKVDLDRILGIGLIRKNSKTLYVVLLDLVRPLDNRAELSSTIRKADNSVLLRNNTNLDRLDVLNVVSINVIDGVFSNVVIAVHQNELTSIRRNRGHSVSLCRCLC